MTHTGEIHWHKEPYVRTSSAHYSLKDSQDMLTHLTNNCFQKKSDQYGEFEEGNILSMAKFEDYIQQTINDKYNLDEHLYPWVKSAIVDTF